MLADNKLAERAGWDSELLALELGELAELGTDLGALGFEAAELDALFGNELPDPREEETPEPPAVPVSRPGDLWLLGPHRLLCGSSTEPADVARLLGGVRPLLMVSDPPYGVAYDPSWRNQAGAASDPPHGQGAERRPGRLARSMGAVSRRGGLCLARRPARGGGRREPRCLRLRDPLRRSSGRRSDWCSAAAT